MNFWVYFHFFIGTSAFKSIFSYELLSRTAGTEQPEGVRGLRLLLILFDMYDTIVITQSEVIRVRAEYDFSHGRANPYAGRLKEQFAVVSDAGEAAAVNFVESVFLRGDKDADEQCNSQC